MNSEDRQHERFDPDAVDEQVERLLQAGDRQHDTGAQITHDLVGLYQQDKASLDRIWRRIAAKDVPMDNRFPERKEIDNMLQKRNKGMDSTVFVHPIPARGRTFRKRIAVLMSVACAVLVVGSLLLVLNMIVQSKHAGSTTASSGALKVSDKVSIYFIDDSSVPGQHNPDTTVTGMDTTSHAILWQRHVKSLASSLKAVGDVVYGEGFAISASGDRGSVFALSLKDGSMLWNVDVGSPQFLTDLTVSNGTVYVMSWVGKIYALDGANGKTNWVYDTKLQANVGGGLGRPGSVSVANGVVYNTVLNTLVAVDAQKGTPLWSKQIDNTFVFSSPIAVEDTIYVTSHTENNFGEGPNQQGYVYAYDAKSGTQKWSYSLNTMIFDPTVVSGKVVFTTSDHHIYALNAKNGKALWSTQGLAFDSFVVADGKVFFTWNADSTPKSTSVKNTLTALDLASGKKLWSLDMSELPGYNVNITADAIKNGIAYVGVGLHQVEALRTSDGKVLSHLDVGKFATDVPFVWLAN